MSKIITVPVDYVCGHLRDGHYRLELSDKEYQEFLESSDEEKRDWVCDGEFIVDSYRIDDIDTPRMGDMKVYDKED